MAKITVVVCSYNRANLLKIALDSLVQQSASVDDFDIIAVDNNSTDNTKSILDSYSQLKNFRAINELEIGLSAARNKGLNMTNSQYVAYLDDDAKADSNWISNALKIIDVLNPDIFGGPIYPYYLNEKPDWFKDSYGQYSVYEKSELLTQGKYLSGSNIFFKTDLLKSYGGFNTNLGMKGKELGYHEETQIQNKAFSENKSIYYSIDLKVYHVVAEIKQNILNFIYANYKSGKEGTKIWGNNIKIKDFFKLFEKYNLLMEEFSKSLFFRDVDKFKFPENYVYEKLGSLIFEIGFMTQSFSRELTIENPIFIEYMVKDRGIELEELLNIYNSYTDKVSFTNFISYYDKYNNKFSKEDLELIKKILKKHYREVITIEDKITFSQCLKYIKKIMKQNSKINKIFQKIRI